VAQAESHDAEPNPKAPESAPVANKPDAGPKAAAPMGEASFESLAGEVQESLPTLKMLMELPAEEVHGTPELIREAGMDLGKVARALQENTHLAARGLEFYTRCAERNDLPRSIRALCLSNAKPLASRLKVERGISVPTSVESLADRAGRP
jgi:hypothetical protein